MTVGRRNCLVTFQTRTTDKSDLGQQVDEWTDELTRWVAIQPLNGREYFAASGENSQVTTRIRSPWDCALGDMTNKNRVVYGSKVYDIETVINDKEQDIELIFMCKLNG